VSSTPVTIIVHRKVKKGQELEAETWMHGVSEVLANFPGALGVEVIRPPNPASPEYTYIYRFTDYESLNAWHDSPERQEWLTRSQTFMAEPPQYEEITGLEYWFTPPADSHAPARPAPKRWRQLIVSWSGLAPLSYLLSMTTLPFFRQLFPDMPLVHSVLNLGVLLWIASYVWMPRVTKLAQGFLHPAK
jgi:hypothetical protein